MSKATIFEGNINDKLQPKLVFAMTYIKNKQLTRVIQNLNPYKIFSKNAPNLSHLQILSSTVYVLLYQEKRLIKSGK